jgi:DNA-directed RNA polymerase specialized sigma subunit
MSDEKKTTYEYVPDPEITFENFDILAKKYRPLIHRHIRLMHQMHGKTVETADLEQEALMALFNAIRNFDPERKVYFPVYLSKAILNKLLCYCRNVLPHFWIKDPEREGKFKRKKVYVDSLDDPNNTKF